MWEGTLSVLMRQTQVELRAQGPLSLAYLVSPGHRETGFQKHQGKQCLFDTQGQPLTSQEPTRTCVIMSPHLSLGKKLGGLDLKEPSKDKFS